MTIHPDPGRVGATSAEQVEVIPLEPRVQFTAQYLLDGTSLDQHVVRTVRDDMFSACTIVELRPIPDGVPVASWSSGEKALWLFLASLSGKAAVNLGDIAAHFRGGGQEHRFTAAIVALFSTDEEQAS